jgi:glutaconate CoA-transferase subunit A
VRKESRSFALTAAGDFVQARRKLEAKPQVAGEKLTTLSEAIQRVRDGDHIAVGGCLFSRSPLAALMEVLRQGRRELTLSRNLMCYEGELFMAAGAVIKLVTSWFGIVLPWGLSRKLREEVEGSRVQFEEWSHLGLGLRYRAGAMGVPFLPTLTMIGSDLMNITDTKTMTCPFTGEGLCLVPALFPDVALLHVHRADRFGNCQIDGYPHMDADIARAAANVIVTAEEIIDERDIRSHPDRTVIPGLVVDAVVEVPWGSFPHECYGLYEADFTHFEAYTTDIRTKGTAAINEYLDRFVYKVSSHDEYLALFGDGALDRQKRFARELVG